MISHRLGIALKETIRDHANQYHHGAQDMERIFSALGEIASSYLAEVPDPIQRHSLFDYLCTGIGKATNAKTQGQESAAVLIS